MIKFDFWGAKSFLRALLVAAVAGIFCAVIGVFISNLLNKIYYVSGSDFFYGLFYALSALQMPIIGVLWFGIMALFSKWILYPSFLSFTQQISQSITLDENAPVPQLPKQFNQLEQQLVAIHKELKLWKYAVQEAEKRKDELVVYLAHDIRTPLTSVLGYLELLDESEDLPAENRRHFTKTALRKAQRMKDLVEELFEVTRFNISHIELHKENVSAGIMLQQLVEEMAPVLEQRQLHIEMDVENSPMLFADAHQMARAVDNILHNAAYYSPVGSAIRVQCSRYNTSGGICISNTGTEVSQSELDRFFEKFYRGDTARQSGTGGSGLGLAIAKNIIETHGGTISAQNANRTTTFTIVIPLADAPK